MSSTTTGGGDGWEVDAWDLDFRVGGREVNGSHMDDRRIAVSLCTIQLSAVGDGCQFVMTEQGAFLDGLDKPEDRRRGTEELLDALGRSLAS